MKSINNLYKPVIIKQFNFKNKFVYNVEKQIIK